MAYPKYDFVVDERVEPDGISLSEAILKHLIINKLKNGKPVMIFIGGGSSEGKSWSILRLNELLGLIPDHKEFINKQVAYVPDQFIEKARDIFFNPENKAKSFCLMEGGETQSKYLWFSAVNQAIVKIERMSRTLKPIVFFMASPDISDVDINARKLLIYYGWCFRPGHDKVHLRLYKVYKTRTLYNPKVLQLSLRGKVITADGEEHLIKVGEFLVNPPSRELIDLFEAEELSAKTHILSESLESFQKYRKKKTKIKVPVRLKRKRSEVNNV